MLGTMAVGVEATAKQLPAARWAEYMASIAPNQEGPMASVFVADMRRGDQRPGCARMLRAISFDPHEDELKLSVGGRDCSAPELRYVIAGPRRIGVQQSSGNRTLVVDDASGVRTVVMLTFKGQSGATSVRRAHTSQRSRAAHRPRYRRRRAACVSSL
jgi:Family of unknown function (DUF5335)